MVRQLRHRQTKGAATAAMNLLPPRHISTSHEKQGTPEFSVCIIERGSEVGAHILSGAVFDASAASHIRGLLGASGFHAFKLFDDFIDSCHRDNR